MGWFAALGRELWGLLTIASGLPLSVVVSVYAVATV